MDPIQAGALAFYILSTLFFNSFVIIFVVTVLLAALDFWVVKNVSGRILVGLRWWNEINDLGESVWKFESLDQESLARMNKKDSWLFWWTLYLAAAAWIVLGIFSLIRFEPDYCLIVGVCLTLGIANIVGFTKCRKELSTNSIAAKSVSSTLTVCVTLMPRSSSSSSQPRQLHLESHLPYSQHSVSYESVIAEGYSIYVLLTSETNNGLCNELRELIMLEKEVMLEKQLIGHKVDRSICAWFWDQVISQGDSFKQQSVIASPTHYLFQIVREGITFLACTQLEMPPLMGIEFLCRVADVLSDYLEGLNEDVIKDNFVIVYELLDEMIDNGFPLTTEPNILREMIAPPNIVSKMLSVVTGNSSNMGITLPGATASCVPWRTTDIKYANNEVYVDLVEEMDAIINRSGVSLAILWCWAYCVTILVIHFHMNYFTLEALRNSMSSKGLRNLLPWDGVLVKCEIYGEVQVNSHITGVPELTLSFANPSIMDDVSFHPCVRFRPWESHHILSFVPPDGLFKLMSYRVKKLKNTPIYVKPQITSDAGTCRINVMVGIRNDTGKMIDSITVQFQLPSCVLSADLTANHGAVTVFSNKMCNWSIDRIPKDRAPALSGTLMLETGLERLHVFPSFRVGFRIQGVALSGLQLDKLDLRVIPSRLYRGFRALTRSGLYEVRS
ncbi:hypothetical protein DKX38_019214 [Salix brachista]|uniref:MHD domain-containing protein n=1 Tax=Salix brachista TaxID=2182728 RepID=A0A5N5KFM6_9ROSI|nr:hypothetical protein DKX38_019214 [Salix brachista]